jgi:thiamine-monophosphate kinase
MFIRDRLGGAAAGLRLLREDRDASGGPEADALRHRQLAPKPRVEAGLALAAAGATAMIDVSDGLGGDAAHLAESSGARLEIDLESLPIQPGATDEEATSGGEDFELLVTLPPERLEEATAAVEATGVRLTRIGAVGEGSGAVLRAADGSEVEPSGFDHFGA